MLQKRFFMGLATDRTIEAVRNRMRVYPSQEDVQTRLRLQLGWDMYCQKVNEIKGIN
jgi:hypothetical protein